MTRRRPRRLQSALRARREALAAIARDRQRRLAAGPELASLHELALMGALILRPRAIRAFAKLHPPRWFVADRPLMVMEALFCCSANGRAPSLRQVVEALARHGALGVLGGEDGVRALTMPRPLLDEALRELDRLVEGLPPAERNAICDAETLDSLDELLEAEEARQERLASSPPEGGGKQLELFR